MTTSVGGSPPANFFSIGLVFPEGAHRIHNLHSVRVPLAFRRRGENINTLATTDYSISTLPANVEAERSILGAILLDT